MKLSIIMPCFNVESTLTRALDSIIMQEVDFEYEVILVDDASTDHTVELAEQYAAQYSQIKIISNKVNKGNAYTYYTGLCASKGDYICVLDGDDYYTIPDKLQRQVDFLDSDTEEEYVGTATQYIIDLGNNMVSIPPLSNFKWSSYTDFLTSKTDYYHTSTYMYRNIFRGNVPLQMGDILYRGDTPRTMFHLSYSGKKIRIMDFVGSAYTFEYGGIWSGLKQKEQHAYQISYYTKHRENVLSDFERLFADKIIENNKRQMDMVADDFRRYPSISIDEALKCISEYAGIFAFAQKDFVLQHAYISTYMDTLCASLGYVDLIRNPQHIQKEKKLENICIVNGVLNPHGGGIFAEIEELVSIYKNKKVYLIVTEMDKIPEQVACILNEYTNLQVLCPPADCADRLGWFRMRFVEIAPYRTYYYCSHKDAYGVALVQKGCCENITLFSFDHGYLSGISNPNLDTIIAKRPVDYWMLKKKFKERVIFIPAWSSGIHDCQDKKYIPFKEHKTLITACGAARFYKVDGRVPYRYIDIIISLLKCTGGVHYHFGELPDYIRTEIKGKMMIEGISQEQFVHIPWVENIPLFLLDKHIDVFIEPFPVVSYKLTLEILSSGVPVIAHQGFMRMGIADFLPPNTMLWKNQEDFLAILSKLTKEYLCLQSKSALDYFNTNHSVEKIGGLLQDNIGLGEPVKYDYPDNTLIEISSSFRLFADNYKIDIMSKAANKKEKREGPNDKGGQLEGWSGNDKILNGQRIILNAIEKNLKRNTIAHLDYPELFTAQP